MRQIVFGVAALFAFVVAIAALYFLGERNERKSSNPLNVEFKAACTYINGTPVYNGQHWVCLK